MEEKGRKGWLALGRVGVNSPNSSQQQGAGEIAHEGSPEPPRDAGPCAVG